jgi:single-strand DNA-binding protein
LRERTLSSGRKFTVLSVAAQRAWKNAQHEWVSKTEWHRIAIFQPRLAEYVMQPVRNGSHVLIEGSLTSSTFERASGKGKKAGTEKITSRSIRADSVRMLDRGEPEPQAAAPSAQESPETSDAAFL